MRVRVPVLRETWDRVEKLPPMIATAARAARRLGTDLSPDDLYVMGTFRETDDRVGYEICRRAFLENRVGMVIDLSSRITSAAGVDWSAVVEIAASTLPAAKLPAGARRLVDVSLDEELVQQAHEEASRLMGREAVTWAQYRAASREDAPGARPAVITLSALRERFPDAPNDYLRKVAFIKAEHAKNHQGGPALDHTVACERASALRVG